MSATVTTIGPSAEEMEAEVLAACMVYPQCVDDALEAGLRVEDFDRAPRRTLWRSLVKLRQDLGDYDEAEIRYFFSDAGLLASVGGAGEIDRLLDRCGSAVHVPRYVEIVREKARMRRLRAAAQDIEAAVLEVGATSADVIALAERTVLSAMRADEKSSLVSVGDSLADAMAPRGGERYLATGVGPLDGKIVGLLASHLTIIPARPSMGKSSLARQIIAGGIRMTTPRRQVVFSCEVDRGTFDRLLVAELSNASLGQVADHIHRGSHVPGIASALEKLSHTPVWIDDTASPTPGEIVRRVRSFADRHGPPEVVVIDHWHLLTHPREKGEREDTAQERGSRMLRALAKEIGAAIVVCAQLTKAGGRGRPTMEDIRECDALAQDAAQIVAPYRPQFRPDAVRTPVQPGETEKPEDAELIVLKNRYGRTGVANAQWIGSLTRYV